MMVGMKIIAMEIEISTSDIGSKISTATFLILKSNI